MPGMGILARIRDYFRKSEFINARSGATDADKPVKTNATGYVDPTFIAGSGLDHGGLSGLVPDDDHTQYHTDARGDVRYPNISTQAGIPATTPAKIGNFNIDTAGFIPRISKATASAFDWVRTDGKNFWRNLGNAGFSSGTATYTSLALKSNGTPYIAFSDADNSLKATVMMFDGFEWVIVGTAGFSGGQADYIVLKFDKQDNLYIAYKDYSSTNKLTVKKFDGYAWNTVGTAGFSLTTSDEISLAFDLNDVPYVSYRGGASGKASVMKYSGGSWGLVGSAEFQPTSAGWTNVAFDSSNVPYFAYKNNVGKKANVMSFDGANWNSVGSADFSPGDAGSLVFAIDAYDVPHVAFRDSANAQKLTVMQYYGSAWVDVGTPGVSADEVYYLSFSFDDNNFPYVAYREPITPGGTVKYANVIRYNYSTWELVGQRGFSAGHANYISMGLTPGNNVFVAYQDGANATKATVMMWLSELAGQESRQNSSEWTELTTVHTTDATLTEIFSNAAIAGDLKTIEAIVICRDTTDTISYVSRTRTSYNNTKQVGDVVREIQKDGTIATINETWSFSGAAIHLSVTGIAAQALDWKVFYKTFTLHV